LAPNPTNGIVTVTLPAAMRTGGRITVFDALGKQVVARRAGQGAERLVLDLSASQEGIYFVEATANEYRTVQRLVLTR